MLKSSRNANAMALLFALNALGIALLYWLRTDQLLKIVLDLAAPDAPNMRAALHAYVFYGAAVTSLALLGVVWSIQRWSRVAIIFGVVAITVVTVFLYVDTVVFRDYGIHAYDFDIARVFLDGAAARDLGVRTRDLVVAVIACAAIIGLEAGAFVLFRRFSSDDVRWLHWSARAFLVAAVIAGTRFYVVQRRITTDPTEFQELLPFHQQVLLEQKSRPFIATSPRLGEHGYPTRETAAPPVILDKRNIVFLIGDAMRADLSASSGLTPFMKAFGERANVIEPQRHFSTGHVTEMGVFGLLYSLNGYHFNTFVEDRVPSYPIAVLKANGYTTAMIMGSPIPPYPSDYLTQMWDTVLRPRSDEDALHMMRSYVNARQQDGKPYFLFTFFYSPHWPFDGVLPQNERYRPTLASIHRSPFNELEDSSFQAATRNSMLNSIIQADFNFARAFRLVQSEYDAGKTAVVITSDHGTEMWERGVFGHGRTAFWNEKFVVPMLMGLPGEAVGERHPVLTSHADIWPTLFDYLRVRIDQPFADGVSWLSTPPAQIAQRRDVILTGRYFPYAARPLATVLPEGKVWFRVYPKGNGVGEKVLRFTTLNDKDRPVSEAPPVADFGARFTRYLRVCTSTKSARPQCSPAAPR